MGDVVILPTGRIPRPRPMDPRASHPSARWIIAGAELVAHRRRDHDTACGLTGDLTLAVHGTPLCPICFDPTVIRC